MRTVWVRRCAPAAERPAPPSVLCHLFQSSFEIGLGPRAPGVVLFGAAPLQITEIPVDQLVPYIRNARTHSADQIAQIAGSIAEFGFVNPILVGEDDVIIAGHGRLLAAQKLGLEKVPVIVLDHLNEAQRRALVIADNRIAENAGWDEELLALELGALRDDAFDLEILGFSEDELFDLLDGLDDPAGEGDGFGRSDEGDEGQGAAAGTLAERFGVPPFSVLDARRGWWQDRKRAWIALGIRSELGRGEDDRACPGGSPMPGAGSRKDYKLTPRAAENG